MASKRQADDDSIDDKSTKYPSLIDSEEPSINDLTYNYEIVYNGYLAIEKIYNEHFIKFEKAQIKFEQLKKEQKRLYDIIYRKHNEVIFHRRCLTNKIANDSKITNVPNTYISFNDVCEDNNKSPVNQIQLDDDD